MTLFSFIGIAINIWRDTRGTGGGGAPAGALVQRDGQFIFDRNNVYIVNIPQS